MQSQYHYQLRTSDGQLWQNWIFADSPKDFWVRMATMNERIYNTDSRHVVSVMLVKIVMA